MKKGVKWTNAWKDWRQHAETNGTILAVLSIGVEKSTHRLTQGRPNLQPLAIPKASITADAGDSSGSSTAPGKGSGGAIFNALMTAAAPASAIGGSDNSQIPTDAETSQDSGEAVAALAAATQVASRGVSLKTTPAPTELSVNLENKLATDISGDVNISAHTEGESDATAVDEPKAGSKNKIEDANQVSDPSGLNVQALIHMAVTASVTVSDQNGEGTKVTEAHVEAKAHSDIDSDAAQALSVTSDTASVSSLTPHVVADVPSTSQVEDAIATQSEQTVSPPKIAALQAVAWSGSKTPKANRDVDTTVSEVAIEAVTPSTIATTDGSLPEKKDGETQSSDASMKLIDPADLNPAAIAVVSAQLVNVQAHAPEGQKPESDDLLLQPAKSPLVQWTDPAAIGSFNQGRVAQSQALASGAANIVKADKPAEATDSATPPSMGSLDALAQQPQALAKDGALATTQSSEIRDVTQFTTTASSQNIDIDTSAITAQQTHPAANEPLSKGNQQNVNARQSETVPNKDNDEVETRGLSDNQTKDSVHIRELLKLGVTDITLNQDAQPFAVQSEIVTLPALSLQDATSSLPSTPQASTVATTNVETNGERRAIADDIRLRALERMVVNAVRNGTQTLSLQLYPPGLGQIVLRIAMDGQRLRLSTRASTTEAADTLRNMETDLRSALSGNGLQLAGFDVSDDGPNDEAPRRQPAEPVIKTRSGGADESFTVELNA